MAMVFKWDQRKMHRVRYGLGGIEIHRGCWVTGIPVVNNVDTGTDPEVFLKVLVDPQCPRPFVATYPTDISPFNLAVLQEIAPETIGDNQPHNKARLDFVYRYNVTLQELAGGEPTWTVQRGGSGSWLETFATSRGGAALTVWYRKGESETTSTMPTDTNDRPTILKGVRGARRFVTHPTLRVTALMRREQWNAIRVPIFRASGKINSEPWGGYGRGTWLFYFPTETTRNTDQLAAVELQFEYDPKGHFSLDVYHDEHGQVPNDIASEAAIRAAGPPPENAYIGRNGLTLASVQEEVDFNDVFPFLPDD